MAYDASSETIWTKIRNEAVIFVELSLPQPTDLTISDTSKKLSVYQEQSASNTKMSLVQPWDQELMDLTDVEDQMSAV